VYSGDLNRNITIQNRGPLTIRGSGMGSTVIDGERLGTFFFHVVACYHFYHTRAFPNPPLGRYRPHHGYLAGLYRHLGESNPSKWIF
jgi:hypothetical protein